MSDHVSLLPRFYVFADLKQLLPPGTGDATVYRVMALAGAFKLGRRLALAPEDFDALVERLRRGEVSL